MFGQFVLDYILVSNSLQISSESFSLCLDCIRIYVMDSGVIVQVHSHMETIGIWIVILENSVKVEALNYSSFCEDCC
jgi:hypothetical protein